MQNAPNFKFLMSLSESINMASDIENENVLCVCGLRQQQELLDSGQ